MDLILDTDALLWMSQGDPRLGSDTRTAVDAATRDGSLRFAAISMLEVARLHWDGRIELPTVPEAWHRELLAAGVRESPSLRRSPCWPRLWSHCTASTPTPQTNWSPPRPWWPSGRWSLPTGGS